MKTRLNQVQLVKAVKDALDRLFENCDVTPDEMRSDLNSIKDEIDSMVESLDGEDAVTGGNS